MATPILDNVTTLLANPSNYNKNRRDLSSIKYIVLHYTGNINDTAKNNAEYYNREIVKTSAHYFVSGQTIYRSVPDDHSAYAVGLGARKEPYIKWPTMWKKITNSNSISIEICGSKTTNEGTDKTKRTACKLVAELLHKYGLSPAAVYRHYDVTGKWCPWWAVEDSMKWLEIKLMVSQYYNGEEGDVLLDTPENYSIFKKWMERYEAEKAAVTDTYTEAKQAMQYCSSRGIIKDGNPKSNVTREQLAIVLQRLAL